MTDKQKLELTRRIGLFGIKDLRKIAPIGNLGYANEWYGPYSDGTWMNGGLERAIMKAFNEQMEKFGYDLKCSSSGYCLTDHHSMCYELGLSWSVDSGD